MSDKMRDDAIREAARNHAGDEYFNADRAYLLVSPYSGRIFDAGFDRGWQAAQAEQFVPTANLTEDERFDLLGEISESGGVGRLPRQSVPVVGEVVLWALCEGKTLMYTSSNRDAMCANKNMDKYTLVPLVVQPTHSITTAELDALRKDAAAGRVFREQLPNTYIQFLPEIDAAIAGEKDNG